MHFSRVHVNVLQTGGDPCPGMLGCSVFTRVADDDADQVLVSCRLLADLLCCLLAEDLNEL